MRHKRVDRDACVRTYLWTCLRDHTTPAHTHHRDQLTYAVSGVMRVHTDLGSWWVPPQRAVWLPAGTKHAEQMHGPVSVRSLYFPPRLAKSMGRRCRTVAISPLLRELILHVTGSEVLDRRKSTGGHLIQVLLDLLLSVRDVPMHLPLPRDTRARRFAAMLERHPDERSSVATLSRRTGASRRTMERLFVGETKMTVGEWRRRLRLLHASRLLGAGAPVTNAALDAGYSSTSAFIAAFKKMFGTTPGRYS